jgi:membrane associated rhomboid family serine protease
MHLIGTVRVRYLIGDDVEDRTGLALHLAFYLLCGLAAERRGA